MKPSRQTWVVTLLLAGCGGGCAGEDAPPPESSETEPPPPCPFSERELCPPGTRPCSASVRYLCPQQPPPPGVENLFWVDYDPVEGAKDSLKRGHLAGDWYYFTGQDRGVTTVRRVRKDGGEWEEVAPIASGLLGPHMFASNSQDLYWLEYDRIRAVPLTGGEVRDLPLPDADRYEYEALAADDERVYVASYACERMASLARDGTDFRSSEQEATLAGGGSPVYLDESHFYCGYKDKIFRMQKAVGSIEAFVEQQVGVGGMTVVEEWLYWIDNGDQISDPYEALWRAARSDGARERVATWENLGQSSRLNHDPGRQRFYWASYAANQPMSYIEADARAEILRSFEYRLFGEYSTWSDVFDDSDYLYWTADFTVVRMRKTD